MTNAVLGIALSANGTCQYPEARSRLERIVAPWRWSSIWSIGGRGKASFFVTSFSRLKSVHIRLLPSFLVTRTIGALYGLFDDRMMFRASISSISFLTTVIFSGANLWGASLMSSVSPVSLSCWTKCVCPSSLSFIANTSLNSRSSVLLSSACWSLSGIAKEQICSNFSSHVRIRFVSAVTPCCVSSVVSICSRPDSASVSQRCTCLGTSSF